MADDAASRAGTAAPGPPVYLRNQLSPEALADYARELERLKREFGGMEIPDRKARERTLACIGGTLREIAALGTGPH